MKRLIVRTAHGILEALAKAGVAMVGPIDWSFAETSRRLEPATHDLDGDR